MRILALFAIAGIVNAITIVGPTDIGNTSAEINIPSNVLAMTPVGESFRIFDTDLYDQTFTYTVTGGTGTGHIGFFTDLRGVAFDRNAGEENLESFSWVRQPFELRTPPTLHQGSTPISCFGPGAFPCTLEFEFGVPLTLRWQVLSVVSYEFNRENLLSRPTLAGSTIFADSNIRLGFIGQFDPLTGWNFIDDATVTISGVPETSSFALGASGLGLLLLGRRLLKARSPERDQP